MDLHEALYTTRAMRRVRPDAIPADVEARILDAAIRAPNGGNQQGWRFLLVDDQAQKDALALLYRDAAAQMWSTAYKGRLDAAKAAADAPESQQTVQLQRSAQWLADHFAEVPLFLFAFTRDDAGGGSIFPAIWSAMLAARAEGVGSCITALLHMFHPAETLEILGVPRGRGWKLAATVSLGYPTGRWGIAARRPVEEVAYRNRWGEPLGFSVPEPLWSSTPDSSGEGQA